MRKGACETFRQIMEHVLFLILLPPTLELGWSLSRLSYQLHLDDSDAT